MKKLIYFVLFCAACVWLYNHCSRSHGGEKVIKQVTVTTEVANLRVGPGTNYDVATKDSLATPWQVTRGTKLDVVGERNGWYEVRIDDQKVYIKKTLCNAPGGGSKSSGRSTRGASSSNASSSPSADVPTEDASTPSQDVEEIEVEEVNTGQYNGEDVVF